MSLLSPSPLSMVVFLAVFKKLPGLHPTWFVALYVSVFVLWTTYAVATAVKIWARVEAPKRAKPI